MIARVSGQIVDIKTNAVVVDVQGVGYEIMVPPRILEHLALDQTVVLMTYHHVRETGQELFGFLEAGEKELFELLLGVSSIGPRGALAIVSLGDHRDIRKKIAANNIAFIAGASGIGKKTAERVCVELKDKVGVVGSEFIDETGSADDDAHAALVSLGYSSSQAAAALAKTDSDAPSEDRVKQALRQLS